ncbi:hypothetical protein HNR60_003319 [Rhodopseudomonas rhenobacensis]|uniref:ATP-binding protein n=1 Tax=Rhodopseudomonas rhenobacensis TaxID=87461 RepID=A0A7W7Z6S8_9BRAD|nr:hypothetical protein [Rhodopseudomonas rhenobacensis]MBB5048552.1 hypothetical protein [Rhodopseudomonas rhenobacensis]
MLTGEVWGLQAKFFDTLGAKQKTQLTESVRQAAANYPSLTSYTICLPFNLTAKTGAKAGKPKSGQHEKISEWITEWNLELAAGGRTIEFDIWDESELLGRLAAADTTGGLERYWFDQEALTPGWFAERLTEAKAQAGPRYSPELTVATPLDEALQAFGKSELWTKKIEQLANNYADKLDWWRKTAEGKIEALSSSPKELTDEAKAVLEAAEPLEQSLSGASENPQLLTLPAFRDAVRLSLARGTALEPKVKEALLAKHGEDADSPGFRQWSAEYMADFPMAPLDHLRDLLVLLREVEVLANQPEGQLPAATGMLLRGEAGIGKTHGILDAAVRRHASGLLSLVLFGEDVTGNDPWQTAIAKLGLGNGLGRDAVLDALNAAGESTGFPLIIFIDALNETQPDRRKWQSWLPPMLEQIKRRPFLKLCVSCREIYVREVMPPGLDIPTIEHNGFLGREYEALFAFFQHYGLGVPAEPLLQEEFANPLFLRLLCEALRDSDTQAIPAGREGIRAIINLLLRAKNERAAVACDYDHRENRVNDVMLRIAGTMAAAGSRTLPLADVRSLVDGPSATQSQSLFAVLESESLVSIIEHPGLGLGAEASYSVRFTFERIGDHLIAENLLAGITNVPAAFSPGGTLHFLAASNDAVGANAGVLEALSIQLPEAHGVELIDALEGVEQALLWSPFIAGLQWRDPQFVVDRTVQLVREGLSSSQTVAAIFEVLLGVAARPDHPLNARFLDRMLRGAPLLARDPFWAYRLEDSFSGWSDTVRPRSGVHRLIETARRGNLNNLPDAVGALWAIMLAWFCASPDRRIRDQATMAMVSIFRARPGCIAPLLQRFLASDDEYIIERVLVAAYGALLLNEEVPDLRDAASVVYDFYFAEGNPPRNASLRDHGRLIIELSAERGVAPDGVDATLYRPPYRSAWPIALPSEESVRAYAEDRERFPQMSLVQKIGLATGTDFARYVVEPRVTSAFDIEKAGLDKLGVFRWFLKEAVEFGYPGPSDQCAHFDRALLSEFGGGRGKPGWAERLGKKYYWIFLRQLVGQMADHADRKTWSATLPPSAELQGLNLRDIDPTDIRQFLPPPTSDDTWLKPAPYVFRGRDIPAEDAGWVGEDDLTDIAQALELTDPEGAVWHILDMDESWNGKRTGSRRYNTYRHVTRSVRAATCDAADTKKVAKAFAKAPLDHFNHGPHDYRGYLGEYPRRWPYTHRSEDPITFGGEDSGVTFHHLALRQLRGREWERDYSQIGESKTLLTPSTALVQASNLQWDHRGGWQDSYGQVQVQDPRWWSEEPAALICRADYMNRFLKENNLALIILGFQMKFIAGLMDGGGRVTERTLFIRHRGKTSFVDRNIVRD